MNSTILSRYVGAFALAFVAALSVTTAAGMPLTREAIIGAAIAGLVSVTHLSNTPPGKTVVPSVVVPDATAIVQGILNSPVLPLTSIPTVFTPPTQAPPNAANQPPS